MDAEASACLSAGDQDICMSPRASRKPVITHRDLYAQLTMGEHPKPSDQGHTLRRTPQVPLISPLWAVLAQNAQPEPNDTETSDSPIGCSTKEPVCTVNAVGKMSM